MISRPENPNRDADRNRRLVEWLARERTGWLRRVATSRRLNRADVDDVVQSALLDVLRSFPGPDDRDAVASYAARCVERRVSKLYRRRRKESRVQRLPEVERNDRARTTVTADTVADPDTDDPLDRVISLERAGELAEELRGLPEDQRRVVAFGALGYSPAEIGAMLSLSPRGVRKRVEKANRRLRHSR